MVDMKTDFADGLTGSERKRGTGGWYLSWSSGVVLAQANPPAGHHVSRQLLQEELKTRMAERSCRLISVQRCECPKECPKMESLVMKDRGRAWTKKWGMVRTPLCVSLSLRKLRVRVTV